MTAPRSSQVAAVGSPTPQVDSQLPVVGPIDVTDRVQFEDAVHRIASVYAATTYYEFEDERYA